MLTERVFSPVGVRRFAAILALATAAVVGGVLATSMSPLFTGAQVGGQIYGCVNPYSGALRIVYAENQCTATERPLSWGQQGEPGVSDVHTVVGEVVVKTEDEAFRTSALVACPEGYQVLGGGAGLSTVSGADAWTMVRSEPIGPEVNKVGFEEWIGIFETRDGEPAVGIYKFTARAICGLTN